jgi:hypothetical protein
LEGDHVQHQHRYVRQLAAVVLGVGLVFCFAGTSAAGMASINFAGGFTLPDDDSGIEPNVTISFAWGAAVSGGSDSCVSDCVLRIDLIYNDSNSGSGLTSNAQGLAGVTWDMTGTATLKTAASQTAADVISPTLVGALANPPATGNASDALNNITVDGVSGEEVTNHWGVRNDLSSQFANLGTNILSSVGDVTFGGVTLVEFMGTDTLLPGGVDWDGEAQPNGIPFAVVDPNTTSLIGASGDVVLAQSSTTGFLIYDGSLTGIDNVTPLFGTDGIPIPEPSTALLLGLGLVGLAAHRRRR